MQLQTLTVICNIQNESRRFPDEREVNMPLLVAHHCHHQLAAAAAA